MSIKKNKKKKLWFSVTAKDCKWTMYRAKGKGGQHRNKTDSAVRCQHEPSGAIGTCEEFREQSKNKKAAFERMATSPEFQTWLNLKIDAGLGKVEIQEGDESPRKLRLDEV
jgi:protein subunit release factor A